jgi:circadian clock protein KaiB
MPERKKRGKESTVSVKGKRPVEVREPQKQVLKLYVTGMTPNSVRAIENLRRICEEHLKGNYELEVIDIYQHPTLASGEQIIAAPTLVRKLPPPLRKFIGDLSNIDKILMGLDIKSTQSKK